MDEALARRHYAEHEGKPFFEGLVAYITACPIIAAVFEGTRAVETVRKTMGATNPAEAEPGTIRGDLGLEMGRNLIHGSDSLESAKREIALFFGEDELSPLPARRRPLGVRGTRLRPRDPCPTRPLRVPPEELRLAHDPATFTFECTDELTPLSEFVGQDRAMRSLQFGLGLEKPGYNIFVTGLTGTGKATAILEYIQRKVEERRKAGELRVADDWCYVYNFDDPDQPNAIRLPPGDGSDAARPAGGAARRGPQQHQPRLRQRGVRAPAARSPGGGPAARRSG